MVFAGPCLRLSTLLCCICAVTCWLALDVNAEVQAQESWPGYTRGKGNYLWATSLRQRLNGITVHGASERLRRVMQRLKSGQPIHITAVGGSPTVGASQMDGLPWPQYVFNYMADYYGANLVNVTNGAMGGTTSHYMSLCSKWHVPAETDIVIMEYAVNDNYDSPIEAKRAQERLVRKMLNLPHKPAVLIGNMLTWIIGRDHWFQTAEHHWNELSMYYHLPTTSLKTCCFQELLANKPGYNTTSWRRKYASNANVTFFSDALHVDGLTGARVFAELVLHLFETTLEELNRRPFTKEEEEEATAPLPVPLFKDNFESLADHCHVGEDLHNIVAAANGFHWINEAKGTQARWGMVANQTGAMMQLKVDTTSPSVKPDEAAIVLISHLKSYQHMGQAVVTCASGCMCPPEVINAHHALNHSQGYLHRLSVTQHKECLLQFKVDNQTQSGEYKFKVTGVVVSEESSGHNGSHLFGSPYKIWAF